MVQLVIKPVLQVVNELFVYEYQVEDAQEENGNVPARVVQHLRATQGHSDFSSFFPHHHSVAERSLRSSPRLR